MRLHAGDPDLDLDGVFTEATGNMSLDMLAHPPRREREPGWWQRNGFVVALMGAVLTCAGLYFLAPGGRPDDTPQPPGVGTPASSNSGDPLISPSQNLLPSPATPNPAPTPPPYG